MLLNVPRLLVASLLDSQVWCNFRYLQEAIDLTETQLFRHLDLLCEVDYVVATLDMCGDTWLRLTTLGHQQRTRHISGMVGLIAEPTLGTRAARERHPQWFQVVDVR